MIINEHPTAVGEANAVHRFHQSLGAAVAAGVQLDLGAVPSHEAPCDAALGGMATLVKLDRLKAKLDEWVATHPRQTQLRGSATGRPATAGDSESNLPSDYLSAYRAFAESERMDLVLDSLALRSAVSQDLAGTVRPVWFYLAAMSLVATMGVVVFSEFSLPRFAAIRADLALMPTAPVDESWLTLPPVRWLLVALPLLSLALVLLGLSTSGSACIASWLGGRRYRSARAVATNARMEQAIWRHRDDVENAASDSETRSGTDRDYREIQTRRVGWTFVAGSTSSLADHRLLRLQIGLPMLLVAVIGGGGVLFYGLMLFGPLVMLIHDLATISTDTGMWP